MVVFSGKPGTGKTHLFESIRNELCKRDIPHDIFRSAIPHSSEHQLRRRIVLGDDAFSRYDELRSDISSSSFGELSLLNSHIIDNWYPNGTLVVMTSNFSLSAIQERLEDIDTMGRALSRLSEMARRGADVPIEGPDYRVQGQIDSIF